MFDTLLPQNVKKIVY